MEIQNAPSAPPRKIMNQFLLDIEPLGARVHKGDVIHRP
jgi:hypothetical protein